MTLSTGKQIITIHILPNISRSKGKHTMKFSQLIEYNMRNNYLDKSYKECGEKTSSRPFSTKSNSSINPEQSVFIVCPS